MNEYRNLVICNNCLWAVSLLKGSNGFKICPICRNENLEVVPVEDHESYKMNIDSKRGIEIDFTKEKKVKGLRHIETKDYNLDIFWLKEIGPWILAS